MNLVRSWYVNGRHYARTCENWLVRQDANATVGIRRLETDAASKGVGAEEGRKMFYRYVLHLLCCSRFNNDSTNSFRVFYMACAEIFAMKGGEE